MKDETQAIQGTAVELRSGVFRPDWSAVTTPAAREALACRGAARPGLIDKWLHTLAPDEDRVWFAVLGLYAALGRPGSAAEIAARAGLPEKSVAGLLRRLQNLDLLALGPDGKTIRHVYPFTEARTGHRVALGGWVLNALCAIDALGAGAMYKTDVAIESACRFCGDAVHVATADNGLALAKVSPEGAVVWYDFAYGGSAAASCCPTIAFFCSDDHLQRWADAQLPSRDGMRLSMSEALEVGRAIFGPVLQSPQPKQAC